MDMNASFISDKYTLPYGSTQMPGGSEHFNQKKLDRALQLQKPLFIIEDSQITPQAAKEFLEQANSQGDGIELNQVMREEAVDALDIRITTDDTIKHLSPAQLANWKELPILDDCRTRRQVLRDATGDRGDPDPSIREGGLPLLLRRSQSGSPDDA